jgi:cobaltochelatase CobS
MSTATATAAWKSYRVGSLVRVGDLDWTITNIEKRATDSGYTTRLFTLRGPNGEETVKTSRGLTFWVNGGESSSSATVTESEIASDARADRTASSDTLLDLIADAVKERVEATGFDADSILSRDDVAAIVEAELAKKAPQRIEVLRVDGTVQDVGVQHAQFAALLRIVSQRLNTWLVGPAGSGKTSAAHAVATALSLPFYAKSVGPQTSESSLIGYYDANGNYVRTLLREAFEFGGVFLLDEVDAGNPAVLVVINALLANGVCAFPDRVVEKHPDFVLLAGANTIGQGADRQYVGRQQIDAATLDRFVLLNWAYDPRIEAAACGVPVEFFAEAALPETIEFVSIDDADAVNRRIEKYVKKVVAIRNSLDTLGKGVRVIVSPRANIHGCKLIRAGFSVNDTLELCVWKGCDGDTRKKIEANCR